VNIYIEGESVLLVAGVCAGHEGLGSRAANGRELMVGRRLRHRQYTRDVGADMPHVTDSIWPAASVDRAPPPRGARG
jgi:xylulose-5-phosphate/fructose-6-phosphate phosphoketolase